MAVSAVVVIVVSAAVKSVVFAVVETLTYVVIVAVVSVVFVTFHWDLGILRSGDRGQSPGQGSDGSGVGLMSLETVWIVSGVGLMGSDNVWPGSVVGPMGLETVWHCGHGPEWVRWVCRQLGQGQSQRM